MNIPLENPSSSTFWRVCAENPSSSEGGKICHCDFRYTIYDCEETYIGRILYIVTAVISGQLALIAIALLYFRLNYRNQKIFEIRNNFPRPKPIESMGVFGIIFNLLQMVHAIFMVTDTVPNPVFRSFTFDVCYQFGYCCFACYLFGVAYTLSDSSRVIYSTWVKSDFIVNILCVATIILPIITNTICSVAAGIYASRNNNKVASIMTITQYSFWTFYCVYLGTLLLFAGVRLIRLLDKHLLAQTPSTTNPRTFNAVRTGALRIKIIVIVGTSCMWIFAFLVCIYSVCRDALLTNQISNMVVAAIWLFAGPIATFFVEIAILINPAIATQLSNLSFGSSSSSDQPTDYYSKKLTSFEFGTSLTKNVNNKLAITAEPYDALDLDEIRFSLNTIREPLHESIDALVRQEKMDNGGSIIEEQKIYNNIVKTTGIRTQSQLYRSSG
ncbi:MAG: hypothetical protein EXX96DRAFT_504238 [Benjaminiella poitrasii]|nr:MAG: hypothetical protein EXX96DRAFT_504238 [Benjaminiella poitrasii]